jgi:hypothetical protein
MLILFLAFLSSYSYGYEVSTHAALAREAYGKSKLETQPTPPETIDLLTRLGVSSYKGDLGNLYLDMNLDKGIVTVRLNNPGEGGKTGDVDFTEDKFKRANRWVTGDSPTFQSPAGWMMVGAIREDDVTYDKGMKENPPQDDPQGSFNRVYNHFYDPYLDGRPMQAAIIAGVASPDWAIDGKGLPLAKNNHFSIKNAREAMFRAVTLKTLKNGQLETLPVPEAPDGNGLTGEQQRKAYWATVFKSLGHAQHLLHDMAQPQHTRDDWHAGTGCIISDNACLAGKASFYEKYLEARVNGDPTFSLPTQVLPGMEQEIRDSDVSPAFNPSAPNYGNYAIPQFNGFREHYTGGINDVSYSAKGLANYSNMGFYSAGTNLDSITHHERPPNDGGALTERKLASGTFTNLAGELVNNMLNQYGDLYLYDYKVTDNNNPADSPIKPLSSKSAFDQFLRAKGKKPVYSLNHYNYNAQADLLLPRAVAYSAGLIDYFFRGEMEISLPKEGIYGLVDHAKFAPPNPATDPINDFKGFGKIKLKLKNTTESIGSSPQTMSNGVLVAVFKFYRNSEYTDDLSGELSDDDPEATTQANIERKKTKVEETVVSEPVPLSSLAFGEETELTFNFPQELPINAWAPVRLSVVFRGKLGDEEDAVAIAEKKISSPVFFTIFNRMDLVNLFGTCYTKEQVNADFEVFRLLRDECNGYYFYSPYPDWHLMGVCQWSGMYAYAYFGAYNANLNKGNITVSWNTGSTAAFFADAGIITPRSGRLAFLVDDEKTGLRATALSWDAFDNSMFYQGPYGHHGLASTRNDLLLQDDDSQGDDWLRLIDYENMADKYFRFRSYRGVKFYDGAYYVLNGNLFGYSSTSGCLSYGGGLTGPPLPDLVGDSERYPVPAASIEGW